MSYTLHNEFPFKDSTFTEYSKEYSLEFYERSNNNADNEYFKQEVLPVPGAPNNNDIFFRLLRLEGYGFLLM